MIDRIFLHSTMTILHFIYNGRKWPSDQHLDLTFLSEWFQGSVDHEISIGSQLPNITINEHKMYQSNYIVPFN